MNNTPRILITVESGVIQSIESDGTVGIFIADLDGFKVGEKAEVMQFQAVEMERHKFTTHLKTIRERFLKENQEQERLADDNK